MSSSLPFSESAVNTYVAHKIFMIYTSGTDEDDITEAINDAKTHVCKLGISDADAEELLRMIASEECYNSELDYYTPNQLLEAIVELSDVLANAKATTIPSLVVTSRCGDTYDVGFDYSMNIDGEDVLGIFNIARRRDCDVNWTLCVWAEANKDDDPAEFDYTVDELKGVNLYNVFKNTLIPQCAN